MRPKSQSNCFHRWRSINSFIRDPSTGRGLTLRQASSIAEWESRGDSGTPWREKELGNFLKKKRASRGMRALDVVSRTNLTIEYVLAIEAGDFSRLPGGLFNRTFVRMYARAVNVTEEMLDAFRIDKKHEDVPAAPLEITAEAPAPVAEKKPRPPRFAEYLLYLFLTKSERVNLIGDTEEEFTEVREKFGLRKAKLWYYKQVFDSMRPLLRRTLSKLGVALWIAKYGDRITELLHRFTK